MLGFNSMLDFLLMILCVYWAASLVAFIPAMIHIVRTKKDVKHKLVWLFICLVLGIVGVMIYYFIERRKGRLAPRR